MLFSCFSNPAVIILFLEKYFTRTFYNTGIFFYLLLSIIYLKDEINPQSWGIKTAIP